MEGDVLCTCTILGKFLWKYIHAGPFSAFDVYLAGLVPLDHRPHCGHLAHTPCGKWQLEPRAGQLSIIPQFSLLTNTLGFISWFLKLFMLLSKQALTHLLSVETQSLAQCCKLCACLQSPSFTV